MQRLLRLSTSLAIFVSLVAPSLAHAAEPGEKPAEDSAAHLTSLELMVRPTFGGAGSASPLHTSPGARIVGDVPQIAAGTASPYGAGFGFGAEIGFRFHPVFSMGLRGDLSQYAASAPGDGTTELARGRQSAGLYARGYPLALSESIRRYLDPWASVGVTYVHDGQSFHHPAATNVGSTVDATWNLDHHAIGIPLGIGVDYRVTRAISVGPSFEYMILAPVAGCAKMSAAGFQDNKICTDNGTNPLVADAAGSWTLGLDIRFTPF